MKTTNILRKITHWLKSLKGRKANSRGDYVDGINQAGSGSSGSSGSYVVSFIDADLTAGVISFTHNLNNQFNIVQIYDELNQVVLPDEITATDVNSVAVDLTSFSPITGTWNIVVG